MSTTQNTVTSEDLVTIARTLRDTALYLSRYGWIQGAYLDQTATVFTPAACTVGAIGMVCYGGPADAPAQMFDDPGFGDFEAAVALLDRELTARSSQNVYEWNDDRSRTRAEVLQALLEIAAECEEAGTPLRWMKPGSAFLTWLGACSAPATEGAS
jgi:hypothetical protein